MENAGGLVRDALQLPVVWGSVVGPFETAVVNLWPKPMGSAGRLSAAGSGRSGPGTVSMILAKRVPETMVHEIQAGQKRE